MWDRAKVLGGLRMDVEYEAGSPFILYGMKSAGQLPADVGVADADHPADKTVLLTVEAAADGDGGWIAVGDAKVVGTLSGPIAAMQAEAGPDDFPAVVAWQSVPTKSREKATVLDFLGMFDGDAEPDNVPGEWGSY